LWNLTGDLGARVRAGCGDWLFLTDELEIHKQRAESAAFRAALASQLDKRLASRGIQLLVAVVPDKTRIEAARLCGIRRPSAFDHRVGGWLESLESQGLDTLDLTATLDGLPGERYYHTDTHWNEAGANAAARAVKDKLRTLGWVTAANGHAITLSTRLVERPGDLIRLAGLDGLPAFLRPKTELSTQTEVAPVSAAGDDLFGDESLPAIALVGTSYSRNSNFAPFLEHHLGEPVANLAKDGGDFAGAATAYFDSATFKDTPPKIVVWEVPERVIEMPVQDVERQWLEKLQSTGGAL
jgi:alginate O-acetyltransferase complex protein AlgJ